MPKKVAKVCDFVYNWGWDITETGIGLLWQKQLDCEFDFSNYKYVLFCDNQPKVRMQVFILV
jgi:hypothetical protein